MTDVPKAFDCIIYDLLIAKLNDNWFDQNVIHNNFFWRSHKTKVGSCSSYFLETFYGVPQSSRFKVLGSLLFNTNPCVLILFEYNLEFTNFTNNTTLYECSKIYDEVMSKLEDAIEKLFSWFQWNNFKANAFTCRLFLSPYKPGKIKVKKRKKVKTFGRNYIQQIVIWWSHHKYVP